MNQQRPPMPPVNAPGPMPGQARAPKPTRKRSGNSRSARTYLLAAVVLAVFAFGVVMLGTSEGTATYVYKAKAPIGAGSIVTADMFDAVEVTDTEIVDGAFSAATVEELAAQIDFTSNPMILYPMPKGSMLVKAYLSENALAAPLAKPLAPGERLISIAARPADAVAGSIRVGDRVDIFAVGEAELAVAQLLVADVEVVAVSVPSGELDSVAQQQVNKALDGEGGNVAKDQLLPGDPLPGVYTIRVTENVAAKLLVANAHTTLVLAYRGPDATTSQYYSPQGIAEALCGVPSVLGDTDGDSLSDEKEKELGTDPLLEDTDNDNYSDGDEVLEYETDPLDPRSTPTPDKVRPAALPGDCLVNAADVASQLADAMPTVDGYSPVTTDPGSGTVTQP